MQPAILEPVPLAASILVFDLDPGADPKPGLDAIRNAPASGDVVVGLGAPLAHLLKAEIVVGGYGGWARIGEARTLPGARVEVWFPPAREGRRT